MGSCPHHGSSPRGWGTLCSSRSLCCWSIWSNTVHKKDSAEQQGARGAGIPRSKTVDYGVLSRWGVNEKMTLGLKLLTGRKVEDLIDISTVKKIVYWK